MQARQLQQQQQARGAARQAASAWPRLSCPARRRAQSQLARVSSTDVAHTTATTAAPSAVEGAREAVLWQRFSAHEASISAICVLEDKQPGLTRFVTASLDKTLASWSLEGSELEGSSLQCTRAEVPGAPVFSLLRGVKQTDGSAGAKEQPVLYCGLASKEVVACTNTETLAFSDKVHLNGHTGWVRSMASSSKYLFSVACNHLKQHDTAFAVPKQVSSTSLFTGDILAVACGERRVFTAGADGSLRAWAIGKTGELTEAGVRERAHDGRITSLLASGSLLYSAGYDGDIKAWDVATLQLVLEAKAAHNGERVRALVLGPPAAGGGSSSSSPTASPAASPTPGAGNGTSVAASSGGDGGLQCFEQQPATSEPCFEQQLAGEPCIDEPQHQLQQQQPAAASVSEAALQPQLERNAPTLDLSELDPVADEPGPAAAAALPSGSEPAAPPQPAAHADSAAPAAQQEQQQQPPPPAAAPSPPPPAPSPSGGAARVLYSGGDDCLVRRWDPRLLVPVGEPLAVHSGSVKALAAGKRQVLVSGDAAGEVAVWLV